jgi:broad specificity phosphatase PhoE
MQAEKVGHALKDRKIEAVYSSPLRRALDTAAAIAKYHKLSVNIENDLREIDAGDMEGVALENLIKDFSHYLIGFNSGDGKGKLPGGESLHDLRQRAWKVVQRILSTNLDSMVIVSHYFVTLSIICAALELPVSSIRKMRVRPAGITIINLDNGKATLKVLNDTCHLS